jgi:hypothetical protein
VRAIVVGLIMAGGHDVKGGIFAPYFKVEDDQGEGGIMRGLSVGGVSRIHGEQHGISIALVNYAWEVNGWQFGLLNYAGNNPRGLRLLPLFNRAW